MKQNNNQMETVSDLQYLFDKYIEGTRKLVPNKRGLKNLILALEANEIYLVSTKYMTSLPNN
jgi:hypothetical protein